MWETTTQDLVLELLSGRRGHFLFESGHHGDLWLETESLCIKPRLAQSVAVQLAEPLAELRVQVVCGPLVEGALMGLMVALELGSRFTYAERFLQKSEGGLFPAGYRVPASLREQLRGKRVAILNDVINAGSTARGIFADLEDCGATVVAMGALLTLGSAAEELANKKGVPLHTLATLPNKLWTASECPLCAMGAPLQDVGGFDSTFASQRG